MLVILSGYAGVCMHSKQNKRKYLKQWENYNWMFIHFWVGRYQGEPCCPIRSVSEDINNLQQSSSNRMGYCTRPPAFQLARIKWAACVQSPLELRGSRAKIGFKHMLSGVLWFRRNSVLGWSLRSVCCWTSGRCRCTPRNNLFNCLPNFPSPRVSFWDSYRFYV